MTASLIARLSYVTIAVLCALAVVTSAAAEDQPTGGVSIAQYMKMTTPLQTTYMLGLIEGHRATTLVERMINAQKQHRPEKEVRAEFLTCRWDSALSVRASIEAVLYRVPREEWDSTEVAVTGLRPLEDRLEATCPSSRK